MEEMSYKFPNNNLLIKNDDIIKIDYDFEKKNIEEFFRDYKIYIECKEVYAGINYITYIIDLNYKTRVSTIKSYKEDLMLNFNAVDVEFQVAVKGTTCLGIHLIRRKNQVLTLGQLISSREFIEAKQEIPLIIGKDFNGNVIIEDLARLPHLLIAGTTGTGKSNLLSTFIVDIVYKLKPSDISLVLVDTRKTNFQRFNKLPHLLVPVITESKKTIGILSYLISEMNTRYKLFKDKKVDNIDNYNKISTDKLSRIVIIIEDFYDLIIETKKEIEVYIRNLIQMSRASGVNVIISTQRPSINVITGVIKANIPSRVAFKVPSQVDSKTIINVAGAEKLLTYGDVLFNKMGECKVTRIQTPYISDSEIEDIISEISIDDTSYYNKCEKKEETDPLLAEAIEYIIQARRASAPMLQRNFKIGYSRAGKIIGEMEEKGLISRYDGSKPREVLITLEEWNELKNSDIE